MLPKKVVTGLKKVATGLQKKWQQVVKKKHPLRLQEVEKPIFAPVIFYSSKDTIP